MEPVYAHSPRKKRGIPAQTYRDHTVRVMRRARTNAARAARYLKDADAAKEFRRIVCRAAAWHDLGKLDDGKQAVLCCQERGSLPFPPHEEAGVAHLLSQKDDVPAAVVWAHHRGFFDGQDYQNRLKAPEKPPVFGSNEEDVRVWISDHLAELIEKHQGSFSPEGSAKQARKLFTTFRMRLALSCLVDADHGDTARHYRQEPQVKGAGCRWEERLAKLREYAGSKPKANERDQRRQRFFEACAAASSEPAMRACSAPVGSGKTLGVMAHLLQTAQAKGLRHVFVVLPYTNIVRQSVEEYRKALTLDGEDPEAVVAELHHLADFADPDLRHLAALWRAPIIVTTAVAFFETIASHHPAALRKLHELPGSAVFLDEAHASLPEALWPVTWNWMREWTEEWGGHLVLGSGSLFRFWEAPGFLPQKAWRPEVPDLVDLALNKEMQEVERTRIKPKSELEPFSPESLCIRLNDAPAPRLAILNTLRSAATIATRMKEMCGDEDGMSLEERQVLHLSTALAPIHRNPVVEEVKRRLRKEPDRTWTLVATSCVEAGMDFSFRCGYREASTVASFVQTSGRVRRNEEDWSGELVSFRIAGEGISQHPAFGNSAGVLTRMIEDGSFEKETPSELLARAFRQQINTEFEQKREELLELEKGYRFPEVKRLYRVIEDNTLLALVDPELVERIENYDKVRFSEIVQASIRVRRNANDIGVMRKVLGRDELWAWTGEYDPHFLGFMASRQLVERIYRDGGFYA